ncbi:hypothetical protein ACFFX0_13625 [Citricoccus parietis]|uniref:Secreted protein n=1 Tax=Citricoccus parietis TaxID=592307 RepID=A0ABV5FZR9_9MICC
MSWSPRGSQGEGLVSVRAIVMVSPVRMLSMVSAKAWSMSISSLSERTNTHHRVSASLCFNPASLSPSIAHVPSWASRRRPIYPTSWEKPSMSSWRDHVLPLKRCSRIS